MDEKQYLKMHAKADEEYRKNLEAIDRVWHMSHPDKAPPLHKGGSLGLGSPVMQALMTQPKTTPTNGSKPFVLSEAVRQAIEKLPGNADISQPIILRKLLDRYPEIKPRVEKDQIKAQIAGLLSRMAKSDSLERVKAAHGSEPGVFKKKPAPLPLD